MMNLTRTEGRGSPEVEQPKVGPEGARLAGASESKDTERATPETDAVETPETDDQPIIYALNELQYQILCVDSEFARKLERERDEARKHLEVLRQKLAQALVERAEARGLFAEFFSAVRVNVLRGGFSTASPEEIEEWLQQWEVAK
jgi:hypothetical protein